MGSLPVLLTIRNLKDLLGFLRTDPFHARCVSSSRKRVAYRTLS